MGVFPAPPKKLGLFRARSSRLLTSACRWGNRRSFLKSVQKGRTARARLTHAFPEVGHALPPASCLGVLGLLGCSGGGAVAGAAEQRSAAQLNAAAGLGRALLGVALVTFMLLRVNLLFLKQKI